MGNLKNENELPPFVTLLSNDFTSNPIEQQQKVQQIPQKQHIELAQSPPPPQLSLEYNFQNRQRSDTTGDEIMSSPCSLPNFKILDNQLQQHISNRSEMRPFTNTATSLMGAIPDDFVFIESVFETIFKLNNLNLNFCFHLEKDCVRFE